MKGLSPEGRVARAREIMPKLVDQVIALLGIHETNRIIFYSDRLARQIPFSRAANAFNQFQRSSLYFEIVRLCALWDSPKDSRFSIRTVCNLVEDSEVSKILKADIIAQWAHDPPSKAFAKAQSEKLIRRLRSAINKADQIANSTDLIALVNFRDKKLAHSLAQTYRESQGQILSPPKLGVERRVLQSSITIVRNLYLGISNTDFDFSGSKRIATRNAKALWHACSFHVRD